MSRESFTPLWPARNELKITNLHKCYASGFELGPINLQVPAGQTLGLLGRNGAGKTTLLRTLLGALRPTEGSIEFGEENALPQVAAKDFIGYVDEEPIYYDWMRLPWIGRFVGYFYSRWNQDAFLERLEAFAIPVTRKYGDLSRGNKVKFGIAVALSIRPSLLLLDEPTSGLDPAIRHEILRVLAEYRQLNPSLITIFSSHIVGDLERISDRAVILREGQVVWDQPTAAFRSTEPSHQEPTYGVSFLEDTFLHLTL